MPPPTEQIDEGWDGGEVPVVPRAPRLPNVVVSDIRELRASTGRDAPKARGFDEPPWESRPPGEERALPKVGSPERAVPSFLFRTAPYGLQSLSSRPPPRVSVTSEEESPPTVVVPEEVPQVSAPSVERVPRQTKSQWLRYGLLFVVSFVIGVVVFSVLLPR